MKGRMTARTSSGILWMTVLACALIFQAVWWIGLTPRPAESPAPDPAPPRVSLWRLPLLDGDEHDPAEDPISLWSPVLFALPSPVGFSRPLMMASSGLRPPVQPPLDASMLLDRPSFVRSDDPAVILDAPFPESHPRHRDPGLRPPGRDGFPRPVGPRDPVLRVFFSGGLNENDFEERSLPVDAMEPGTSPWEIEAFLSVDEHGNVNRVILEKRAEDEQINRSITRALYAWRMDSEKAPASGRLRLYLVAPAGEPQIRQEAP